MIETIVLWIGWVTVAIYFVAGWLFVMAAIFDWILKGMELNQLFIQFAAHKIHERAVAKRKAKANV